MRTGFSGTKVRHATKRYVPFSLQYKGGLMKYFIDRLFDIGLYVMLVVFVANLIMGAI